MLEKILINQVDVNNRSAIKDVSIKHFQEDKQIEIRMTYVTEHGDKPVSLAFVYFMEKMSITITGKEVNKNIGFRFSISLSLLGKPKLKINGKIGTTKITNTIENMSDVLELIKIFTIMR